MSYNKDLSRKPHLSTDDLINDYLSDIMGESVSADSSSVRDDTQSMSSFFGEAQTKQTGERLTLNSNAFAEGVAGNKIAGLKNDDALIDVKQVAQVDIKHRHFLIPTLKLGYNNQQEGVRSQNESILILLTNLYFLRRPLSPRVRQCFLDLSEQVIDDYQASQWLRHASVEGVMSEV